MPSVSALTSVIRALRHVPGALNGGSAGKVLAQPAHIHNRPSHTLTPGTLFDKNPALSRASSPCKRLGQQLQCIDNPRGAGRTMPAPQRSELHPNALMRLSRNAAQDAAPARSLRQLHETTPPRQRELHPFALARQSACNADTLEALRPSLARIDTLVEACNPMAGWLPQTVEVSTDANVAAVEGDDGLGDFDEGWGSDFDDEGSDGEVSEDSGIDEPQSPTMAQRLRAALTEWQHAQAVEAARERGLKDMSLFGEVLQAEQEQVRSATEIEVTQDVAYAAPPTEHALDATDAEATSSLSLLEQILASKANLKTTDSADREQATVDSLFHRGLRNVMKTDDSALDSDAGIESDLDADEARVLDQEWND